MVIEVLTLSFTFLVHMNADFGLFMMSLFMFYEIKALCTIKSKPKLEKFFYQEKKRRKSFHMRLYVEIRDFQTKIKI